MQALVPVKSPVSPWSSRKPFFGPISALRVSTVYLVILLPEYDWLPVADRYLVLSDPSGHGLGSGLGSGLLQPSYSWGHSTGPPGNYHGFFRPRRGACRQDRLEFQSGAWQDCWLGARSISTWKKTVSCYVYFLFCCVYVFLHLFVESWFGYLTGLPFHLSEWTASQLDAFCILFHH